MGDFDVFGSSHGTIVGWIGGEKRLMDPKDVDASNTFDPELLRPCIVPDFPLNAEAVKVIDSQP